MNKTFIIGLLSVVSFLGNSFASQIEENNKNFKIPQRPASVYSEQKNIIGNSKFKNCAKKLLTDNSRLEDIQESFESVYVEHCHIASQVLYYSIFYVLNPVKTKIHDNVTVSRSRSNVSEIFAQKKLSKNNLLFIGRELKIARQLIKYNIDELKKLDHPNYSVLIRRYESIDKNIRKIFISFIKNSLLDNDHKEFVLSSITKNDN